MPDTITPHVLVGAITLEVKALRDALGIMNQVVERGSTTPVLRTIMLTTDDMGQVSILGTDMEIAVTATLSAEYPLALSPVCVDLAPLLELVKNLPAGARISITGRPGEDGGANIACDGLTVSLPGRPHVDFPLTSPDVLKGGSEITLTATLLSELFRRVSCSISTEETRFYLNGIYFTREAERQCLKLVSTDGHRMSAVTAPEVAIPELPGATKHQQGGIIVPREAVDLITKVTAKAPGDARIEFSDTRMRVSMSGLEILTKLIDGTFPDYQRVLPKRNPEREIILPLGGLESAFKRVTAISSERSQPLKIEAVQGDRIYLSARSESGGAQCHIASPAPAFSAEIGFQARYLVDMVRACPLSELVATFGEEGGPARFDAGDWTMVLMPVRV